MIREDGSVCWTITRGEAVRRGRRLGRAAARNGARHHRAQARSLRGTGARGPAARGPADRRHRQLAVGSRLGRDHLVRGAPADPGSWGHRPSRSSLAATRPRAGSALEAAVGAAISTRAPPTSSSSRWCAGMGPSAGRRRAARRCVGPMARCRHSAERCTTSPRSSSSRRALHRRIASRAWACSPRVWPTRSTTRSPMCSTTSRPWRKTSPGSSLRPGGVASALRDEIGSEAMADLLGEHAAWLQDPVFEESVDRAREGRRGRGADQGPHSQPGHLLAGGEDRGDRGPARPRDRVRG